MIGSKASAPLIACRFLITSAFLIAGFVIALAFPTFGFASPWADPQRLLGRDHVVDQVRIGAGPGNYAVAIWTTGTDELVPDSSGDRRVFASVRGPNARRFGARRGLSPRGVSAGRLAVAANGDTFVGWRDRNDRVKVVSRTPESGWTEPETLSGPVAGFSRLAAGGDGTAVAAWVAGRSSEWRVEAAVRPPGGSFGEAETVARDPTLFSVPVVAAGRGQAALAWETTCQDGPEEDPAMAALLASDGSFDDPEPIPNSGCSTAGIRIAIDDHGTTIVLSDGLPPWVGPSTIRASIRPPDGPFPRAEPISTTEDSNFAELGMSGDGRAVAMWSEFDGDRVQGGSSAVREPGGEFSAPQHWPGRSVRSLAVGDSGDAVAVFPRLSHPRPVVLASYMPPGGEFGERHRVSGPLTRDVAADPQGAMSPEEDAYVAWGNPRLRRGGARGIYVAKRAPNCTGIEATIHGTGDADDLRGTRGRRDVVVARAGDDVIHGRGGDNVICTGSGDDLVRPGQGNNRVHAGRGDDRILARAGGNRIATGRGDDRVDARAPGRSRITVGRGDNRITTGAGDDRIIAGSNGENRIEARIGRNRIRCGPGRDVVITNHRSWVDHRCDRVVRR